MKITLVLGVVILIFNIISLNYDNLISLQENRNEYINIVIAILIIIMTYYKKEYK